MATLLHLDSSLFSGDASSSRAVTAAFRRTWQEHHPEGTVIYRDLATNPVPHLTADAHTAGQTDPATHTPAQAAALAHRLTLIDELENADAILIGAPMYNYSIPSTLKAWLDNIVLVGRTAGVESSRLKGTPVTVVASRGGSYRPGHAPRGLRIRAELPHGRSGRRARPGRELHRPGAHDGRTQSGDVPADPPLRSLPPAGTG